MAAQDRRSTGQWQEPRGGGRAGSVQTAVIVESANGGWAVSTERRTPEAYLQLDANGAPTADEAATSGARIRITDQRIQGIR